MPKNSHGGGISLIESAPLLENIIITDNGTLESGTGGAIYCDNSNPIIINTLIKNNTSRFSPVFYITNNSDVYIYNSTVVNNQGPSWGTPCIYFSNSSANFINIIFWSNKLDNEIYFYGDETDTLSIQYSCIEGGIQTINDNGGIFNWGEGNKNLNPLFENAGQENYELAYNSPLIDNGIPDISTLHLPETDLNGNITFSKYSPGFTMTVSPEFVWVRAKLILKKGKPIEPSPVSSEPTFETYLIFSST